VAICRLPQHGSSLTVTSSRVDLEEVLLVGLLARESPLAASTPHAGLARDASRLRGRAGHRIDRRVLAHWRGMTALMTIISNVHF
jgi:hypothetical protein